MSDFRFAENPGPPVTVTIDGHETAVSGTHSLLASMLALGAPVEFFCAIGQCQRCLVLIDGTRRPACLYHPRGGETVSTRLGSARA